MERFGVAGAFGQFVYGVSDDRIGEIDEVHQSFYFVVEYQLGACLWDHLGLADFWGVGGNDAFVLCGYGDHGAGNRREYVVEEEGCSGGVDNQFLFLQMMCQLEIDASVSLLLNQLQIKSSTPQKRAFSDS